MLNLDLNDLEEAAYNVIVDAGMNTHAMTCNDNFSDEKTPNIFREEDHFNLEEYNLRPVEPMELVMNPTDQSSYKDPPNIFRDDDPFNLEEYNLRPVEAEDLTDTPSTSNPSNKAQKSRLRHLMKWVRKNLLCGAS